MAAEDGTQDDTFYLGLTMAGAISAGAYTAGVLDTLFAALDRHNLRYEQRKQAEAQAGDGPLADEFRDHPRHRVALRVISGTSAGGVSAGLAVAGLIGARGSDTPDGLELGQGTPETFTSASGYRYDYSYILKPLHYVWVEAMDLFNPGTGKGFLTTEDLDDGRVLSALNSGHIDQGATTALQDITWSGGTYRFLTRDLDLFLTTTNLQGIPYDVGFAPAGRNSEASHAMAQHSTIRHFRVSGLGDVAHSSPWLEAWRDMGITLPLTQDVRIDFEPPEAAEDASPAQMPADPDWLNWAKFKKAAVATGAFPVGLAPRIINAQAFIWFAMGMGVADGTYQALFYSITGMFVVLLIIGVAFTTVAAFRFIGGREDDRELLAAHAIYWYAVAACYAGIWFLVYVTK